MKVLNEIMSRVDEKSSINEAENISNYKEFENLMGGIYEKSFDQRWMNNVDAPSELKIDIN